MVTTLEAPIRAMKTGSRRLHFGHLALPWLAIVMVTVESYMEVSDEGQPELHGKRELNIRCNGLDEEKQT